MTSRLASSLKYGNSKKNTLRKTNVSFQFSTFYLLSQFSHVPEVPKLKNDNVTIVQQTATVRHLTVTD